MKENEKIDQVLIALRKIIRAIDLHSHNLVHSHGLTGPQALVLKSLQTGGKSAGELASLVSLSQGTVTDIVKRLEQKKLVIRTRDTVDRRRVHVEATDLGTKVLEMSPPLLQEKFSEQFSLLQDWEQSQLLAVLQRIASMMGAEKIDAAPVLSSGSVLATEQYVENLIKAENDPSSNHAENLLALSDKR